MGKAEQGKQQGRQGGTGVREDKFGGTTFDERGILQVGITDRKVQCSESRDQGAQTQTHSGIELAEMKGRDQEASAVDRRNLGCTVTPIDRHRLGIHHLAGPEV